MTATKEVNLHLQVMTLSGLPTFTKLIDHQMYSLAVLRGPALRYCFEVGTKDSTAPGISVNEIYKRSRLGGSVSLTSANLEKVEEIEYICKPTGTLFREMEVIISEEISDILDNTHLFGGRFLKGYIITHRLRNVLWQFLQDRQTRWASSPTLLGENSPGMIFIVFFFYQISIYQRFIS